MTWTAAAAEEAPVRGRSAGLGSEVERRKRKPNILVIVTDDQRVGTLSPMPQVRGWFKRNGTEFSRAFSTTPLCCPSRSSIFTGRYAHNHEVQINGMSDRLDQDSTIQRYLRDAGYRTAIVGKYLNGWPISDSPPSFDKWAITDGRHGHYLNVGFNINGNVRETALYSTDYIGRKSVQFLRGFENRDRRPWLLFVFPLAPHAPFIAEPRYSNLEFGRWIGNPAVRERNVSDKPPWVRRATVTLSEARKVRTAQLRTIRSVDQMVGKIRKTLRRNNEIQRTLAFFLSDNGFLWGEHGLRAKPHPYTQGVQIPLLASWPGHTTRGRNDRRLVANIDLAPTMFEAAGVEAETVYPFDGRSLFSSIAREFILLENWQSHTWASLWSGRYQYIEHSQSGEPVFKEYYDLTEDSWELNNLLSDERSNNDPDVDVLHVKLIQASRCSGTTCP